MSAAVIADKPDTMTCRARWFYPDIRWIRAGVVPIVVLIACCLDRGYQTDFWHHLARGRAIVSTGNVVNVDLFTCSLGGSEIRDANWLSQVIFFDLYRWGGLNLVQTVNGLILALTLAMVFRLCRRAGASDGISAVISAFTFFGLWQTFLIRPQSFSLLLFVLLYYVLAHGTQNIRLIVCPLILGVWCNLHGGFPIGLLLIAAFAAAEVCSKGFSRGSRTDALPGDRFAPLSVLTLMLSLFATLINPYGWRVYVYAGALTARAAGRGIEEWLPPHPSQMVGLLFFASIVLLAATFLLVRRRPRLLEICLVLLFLPLACRSVRMTAWWFLVIAPVVAGLLADRFAEKKNQPRPSWVAGALAGVLGIGAIMSLPWLERINPLFRSVRTAHRVEDDLQAVAAAGDLLAAGSVAPVLTRLEWGDYFDWSLGPSRRVFMDGRIELFPDPLWRDYGAVTSGKRGWQQILDRYAIDYLVLDGTYHAELLAQVRRSPVWEQRTKSGEAILFRRRALSGLAQGS
jgi:hypothetical protein